LPIAERKRGVLPSSRIPAAARYSSMKASSLWCARHFVALAAFLVEAHLPALAGGVIVLDLHGDDGAHEGVGHDADQRTIAQADQR
jgi:hypothetical protein